MGDQLYNKYFGSQGDEHGGHLSWPGIDGIPVRTSAADMRPLLNGAETEEIKTVYDAKVRIFDLQNPADLSDYQSVWDHHHNGWYRVTSRESQYDSQEKTWRILMEWVQPYGELTQANKMAMGMGG